jgi:2-dehydropantoate 2-reductase
MDIFSTSYPEITGSRLLHKDESSQKEAIMNKDIAVLGTGAIGSCIGADLRKAGHDVLLFDQWPAHVEAMKTLGLHVTMPGEEFQIPVQAFHLCDLRSLNREFDIVFLTAKSYDTRWMVELIKPYLKADGVLVAVQNGLNDPDDIVPIIGHDRDVACAVELSGEVFEPGLIKRNNNRTKTRFVIGKLDGTITSQVREVAQLLSEVGQTQISTNILGAKWTKLVLNTMGLALPPIGGIRTWEAQQNPRYLNIAIILGRETIEVGAALGYVLEPVLELATENLMSPTDEELKKFWESLTTAVGKETRTCIQQDLLKGRVTEIGYINGLVVRKGQEVNVPTPLNKAVTNVIRQIEQGILKPDLSNIEILEQHM